MADGQMDIIPTGFEKKFKCPLRDIAEFLQDSEVDNADHVTCTRGEHDLSGVEKVYAFDGNPYKLGSSVCSNVECFLSGLEASTLARQKGREWEEGVGSSGKKGAADTIKRNKDENPTMSDYAAQIMEMNQYLTMRDTREVLWYEDGMYRHGGEPRIEEEAERIVSMYEECGITICREIIDKVRRKTYVDRTVFDTRPELINLKNGMYNMNTGKLEEHDPGYPSRVQLDVEFDPEAKCPKFEKFLSEILPSESDRISVMEMFASVLVARMINLEMISMFVGESRNGKTTLLKTFVSILDRKNCSFSSIQRLADNRFEVAGLDGKLANVAADINDDDMRNIGVIKSLVSGDMVNAEKKNKPAFEFENYAKFFFSCNRLPRIGEASEGVYRRFRIIEFKVQFIGDQINRFLYDELVTEKPGILNLLIHHAKTLLGNGKFSVDVDVQKTKEEWKGRVDPVRKFVTVKLEERRGSVIPKDEMYAAYVEFCAEIDEEPEGNRMFSSKMSDLGYIWKKAKVDGKGVNAWIDLGFGGDSDSGKSTSDDNGQNPTDVLPLDEDKEPDHKPENSDRKKGGMLGNTILVARGEFGGAKGPIFKSIYDALGKDGEPVTFDGMMSEIVKIERWDEEESSEYLLELVDSGAITIEHKKEIKKRWRCVGCGAGPFLEGESGFGGKSLEEYHKRDGCKIEYDV